MKLHETAAPNILIWRRDPHEQLHQAAPRCCARSRDPIQGKLLYTAARGLPARPSEWLSASSFLIMATALRRASFCFNVNVPKFGSGDYLKKHPCFPSFCWPGIHASLLVHSLSTGPSIFCTSVCTWASSQDCPTVVCVALSPAGNDHHARWWLAFPSARQPRTCPPCQRCRCTVGAPMRLSRTHLVNLRKFCMHFLVETDGRWSKQQRVSPASTPRPPRARDQHHH